MPAPAARPGSCWSVRAWGRLRSCEGRGEGLVQAGRGVWGDVRPRKEVGEPGSLCALHLRLRRSRQALLARTGHICCFLRARSPSPGGRAWALLPCTKGLPWVQPQPPSDDAPAPSSCPRCSSSPQLLHLAAATLALVPIDALTAAPRRRPHRPHAALPTQPLPPPQCSALRAAASWGLPPLYRRY